MTPILTIMLAVTVVSLVSAVILLEHRDELKADLANMTASRDMYKTMYDEQLEANRALTNDEPVSYIVTDGFRDQYNVIAYKLDGKTLVKAFPYDPDDEDDRDYAMRCALELQEKLEEQP